MTAHEFAVGVLQMLIGVCAIGGVALLCEYVIETRRCRKREKMKAYRMKFDYADDRRKAARRNASIR